MDPQRWNRIERLFTESLLRPVEDREAYIARAISENPWYGGDPTLAAEVHAMLAEMGSDELEIETRLSSMTDAAQEDDPWIGRVVGPYRLERRIGEGGMGLVYLAERIDGSFERSVAVKVLARRLGHPEAHRRFEEERRILAGLDHPGIARLLDGGSIDNQPYLVMELVIGDPITTFCEERSLNVRDRIRLFRRVCEAVNYAHRNLVVHRDLKPANLLVTPLGSPKLLDFGIAKILQPEADRTATGMRALTPEYAAPEQVLGQPVTMASDVYALGGLLYRLLSGHSPYGDHTSSPYTLEQAIIEHEPEPLTGVDRDLSTIVEKALRKDSFRRYGSAGELSADLGRYLNHEPVEARPDTWRYRSSRFVRRHRAGVALTALAAAGLVAFGGTTYAQAQRLEAERNAAQVARDESEAVVDLLVNLFQQNAPTLNPGGDTVRLGVFLDDAQGRVLEGLDERPELLVRMQEVFGRVNIARDRMDDAEILIAAALDGRRTLVGGDDSVSAMILQQLVKIRSRQNQVAAEPIAREALALQRSIHGERHRNVAEALQDLAAVTVDAGSRVALIEQAIDIRQSLADEDPLTPEEERIGLAGMYNSLAIHHWRLGDFAAASQWFERSLEQLSLAVPEDHPYVLTVSDNLASAYDNLGQYQTAERMLRSALGAREVSTPAPSAGVATTLNNLSSVVARQGRLGEAIDLAEQSLDQYRTTYGEGHVTLGNTLKNLSTYHWQAGRTKVATDLLDQSIAILEDAGQDGTFGTRGSLSARILRTNYMLSPETTQAVLDSVAAMRPLALSLAGDDTTQELMDLDQTEAWARLFAGDAAGARTLFERVTAFAEPRVGRAGSTYLEAAGGLGLALAALDEADESRALLAEVVPAFAAFGLASPTRLARMQETLDRLQ